MSKFRTWWIASIVALLTAVGFYGTSEKAHEYSGPKAERFSGGPEPHGEPFGGGPEPHGEQFGGGPEPHG